MRRFTSHELMSRQGIDAKLRRMEYPRELSVLEMTRSAFYSYGGDDCMFWLERVIGEPRTSILHLVVRPDVQKNHGIAPRKLFQGLEVICDLEGIDRLIANDCTESGEVTDYLRRLGWTPCTMETIEGEWFEKRFTDGDEESHVEPPSTEDQEAVC